MDWLRDRIAEGANVEHLPIQCKRSQNMDSLISCAEQMQHLFSLNILFGEKCSIIRIVNKYNEKMVQSIAEELASSRRVFRISFPDSRANAVIVAHCRAIDSFLICEMDSNTMETFVTRRIKLGDEKFSSIKTTKINVNREFATAVQKQGNVSSSQVIYLDSEFGLTSSFLAIAKFRQDQLFVPNVLPQLKNVNDAATWIPNTTMFEFLRDYDGPKNISHIGYDACCSPNGNSTYCKPFVDLELLFSSSILARNGGVLWVTFCIRGLKVKVKDIQSRIQKLAVSYGYNLEEYSIGLYDNGRMAYFIFISRSKEEKVLVEKGDFVIVLLKKAYDGLDFCLAKVKTLPDSEGYFNIIWYEPKRRGDPCGSWRRLALEDNIHLSTLLVTSVTLTPTKQVDKRSLSLVSTPMWSDHVIRKRGFYKRRRITV